MENNCRGRLIGLLNGPNLRKLGEREPKYYGLFNLDEAIQTARAEAAAADCELLAYQSDSEAELIRFLSEEGHRLAALVINAAALSHSGFALYDALLDFAKPAVEIHISDINLREPFRRSIIRPACQAQVMGWGIDSYRYGVRQAIELLEGRRQPVSSGRTDSLYATDPRIRLQMLRDQISEIDQAILDLLKWRQSVMPYVVRVKQKLGRAIQDGAQEARKRQIWQAQVEPDEWPRYGAILEEILTLAKQKQKQIATSEPSDDQAG